MVLKHKASLGDLMSDYRKQNNKHHNSLKNLSRRIRVNSKRKLRACFRILANSTDDIAINKEFFHHSAFNQHPRDYHYKK